MLKLFDNYTIVFIKNYGFEEKRSKCLGTDI